MENAEFYRRVEHNQPIKPKRREVIKWKQVLAVAALIVFLSPFFPGKRHALRVHFPTDWFDYLEKVGFFAVIVCAILFVAFIYERTQFTSAAYHFKWVGIFEVNDKILKPKKRISLCPGTNHLVSVDNTLFHQLMIGDKVEVERRLTGEVISIKKRE